MTEPTRPRPALTRRECLGGLALLGFGFHPPARAADPPTSEVEAVRTRAKAAGLKDFGGDETAHYLAVGDAPAAFRREALALCEELASTFLSHFKAKGFSVALPASKLTVLALKGAESYAAFKGEPVGEAEGGHYEINSGRLVIFDVREGGQARADAAGLDPRRANTLILVHEAIHQLTYGTGMLGREGDVPVAVSEGLATYGELWRNAPRGRVFGQVNRPRLGVLANPGDGPDWIDLADLLARDDAFLDEKTEQLAYAESWLFAYEQFKTRAATTKLAAYLNAIKLRKDASKRLEDAEKALGGLDRLDRDLKRSANRLIRG